MPERKAMQCLFCGLREGTKDSKTVKFHRVWSNKKREAWVPSDMKENITPNSAVCSRHFTNRDYTAGSRLTLKKHARPKVPRQEQKTTKTIEPESEPPRKKHLAVLDPNDSDRAIRYVAKDLTIQTEDNTKLTTPQQLMEHSYVQGTACLEGMAHAKRVCEEIDATTPHPPPVKMRKVAKSRKRKHSQRDDHNGYVIKDLREEEVERLRKRIKKLEKENKSLKRAKKNLTKQRDTVKGLLADAHEMMADQKYHLSKFEDFPIQLFREGNSHYTDAQKKFAMTMHLYGPKAYKYLRTQMNNKMPSPRTIQWWLRTVDDHPGLCFHLLDSLKNKRAEDEGYAICTLVIDGMAIRQLEQWIHHEQAVVGCVDLGGGIRDLDSTANEVLVLMAVGISKRWKAPVSFHFTRHANSETQAQLILAAIEQLHERKIEVKILISDGAATNLATLNQLGSTIPETPWFSHPQTQKKVYTMLDPVHMVKVLRNCLADHVTIQTPDGTASWQHIKALNDVQESGQLHLANKLTKRHIDFENNKMKVKFATQVFSQSVADALITMEELDHPSFKGASATASLLKRMDTTFDILNSRSLYGKYSKAPINRNNMQEKLDQLAETAEFLEKLKTTKELSKEKPAGTLYLNTNRKTAFVGFITAANVYRGLIPELLNDYGMNFVLTYRMNQDHLEHFFNALRKAGGSNNNPSAYQVRKVMRRYMVHIGELPAENGNCQVFVESDDAGASSLTEEIMSSIKAGETGGATESEQSTGKQLESDMSNVVPESEVAQGEEDSGCIQEVSEIAVAQGEKEVSEIEATQGENISGCMQEVSEIEATGGDMESSQIEAGSGPEIKDQEEDERDYEYEAPEDYELATIGYQAGYIVRKFATNCEECRQFISTTKDKIDCDTTEYKLLMAKDRGGLVFPSEEMIDLVKLCDRRYRELGKDKKGRYGKVDVVPEVKLRAYVKGMLPGIPDKIDQHAKETWSGISNHYFELIDFVCKNYSKARNFHVVKRRNLDKLKKVNIRQKNNKNTIFSGV